MTECYYSSNSQVTSVSGRLFRHGRRVGHIVAQNSIIHSTNFATCTETPKRIPCLIRVSGADHIAIEAAHTMTHEMKQTHQGSSQLYMPCGPAHCCSPSWLAYGIIFAHQWFNPCLFIIVAKQPIAHARNGYAFFDHHDATGHCVSPILRRDPPVQGTTIGQCK